jgi:hypothetical protein
MWPHRFGCPPGPNIRLPHGMNALTRRFCQSRIDVFSKAAPDPTSGSLLGVLFKVMSERNSAPVKNF